MKNEIWKTIIGFENYQISNLGRIKSLGFDYIGAKNVRCVAYPKILKIIKNKSGYEYILLRKNRTYKNVLVHRLVATFFIENKNNKKEVNHINGIKDDNRVENLEWCTRSENILHKHNVLNIPSNRKGVKNCGNIKSVIQIDFNSNKTIKTFVSISDANRETGIQISSICSQLKGKYKHAGGYKWEYAKQS